MEGKREDSIISHRPVVTRNDLKQEGSVFRESVSIFLQLVVAFVTINPWANIVKG